MELEKEIKQKNFRSPYHKLMVNLIFTGNWINNQINQAVKPFGITPQQYNVLRILKGQHPEPSSILLITERMLDKMSNASRLVEKLRTKGLLERKACKDDRRQVDVIITKKGIELLEQITKEVNNLEEELTKAIEENEAKGCNEILDKLRN